jgi:hypothetical protein
MEVSLLAFQDRSATNYSSIECVTIALQLSGKMAPCSAASLLPPHHNYSMSLVVSAPCFTRGAIIVLSSSATCAYVLNCQISLFLASTVCAI